MRKVYVENNTYVCIENPNEHDMVDLKFNYEKIFANEQRIIHDNFEFLFIHQLKPFDFTEDLYTTGFCKNGLHTYLVVEDDRKSSCLYKASVILADIEKFWYNIKSLGYEEIKSNKDRIDLKEKLEMCLGDSKKVFTKTKV